RAGLRPEDPQALVALGRALLDTAAATTARKPLRAAVERGVEAADVLLSLASLELLERDYERAEALYRRVLEREPQQQTALYGLFFSMLAQWRWAEAERERQRGRALTQALGGVGQVPGHMLLMVYGDDPPALLPGMRPAPPLRARPRTHAGRLRVGYLSSDFHTHATAILMAGLFERHDRTRFECFLYSYGPRGEDAYRNRLRAAAEHWCDLNELDDEAASERIRRDRLDVLIELKGHTYGMRPGITTRRPCPIQLHYLGFPGPIGGYGIDGFIADEVTVPPGAEGEFPETVLRLPRCYQVNDSRRPRPKPALRQAHGLPEEAIVLANFNQSWKITEPFMRIWLEALARHPRACLWLLDPGERARTEALRLAAQVGLPEPERRLIFAARAEPEAHIDRLALADLALDQLPCSSHTTAADALWAGVPLLTCAGARFAGRVGASVARAAGLDRFVVDDREAYARKLDQLLTTPQLLAEAKAELNLRRDRLALFDTDAFTRDFEALLTALFTPSA
ncbi:MAG: hypothetical protein N3F11_06580, partial [Casimicrobiaceae bacterium]|nr:hypothetical protein [Casimicrobiaceae bacterium]